MNRDWVASSDAVAQSPSEGQSYHARRNVANNEISEPARLIAVNQPKSHCITRQTRSEQARGEQSRKDGPLDFKHHRQDHWTFAGFLIEMAA